MQDKRFGYFDDDNREYVITDPKTPWPWINYLGNEDFFSLISNTAGGYSFYKDAKFRRITRYRYNNVPMDNGGRYFYINEGGNVWSPTWKPCKTALDSYECRHGMSYTRITGSKDGIEASLLFFVPLKTWGEVQKLTLRNTSAKVRKLKLFSFAEWCLWNAATDMENFQRNFSTGEVEVDGSVIYHKTEYKERRNHYAFYSVNTPVDGFDTDRETFVGLYNEFADPERVVEGRPGNSIAHGWSPIASHYLEVELQPGESRDFIFLLGYVEKTGELPAHLTFSLASLMSLYRGGKLTGDGRLECQRDGQPYYLQDDAAVLNFFAETSSESPEEQAKEFLSNETFFGPDLCKVPGLVESVGASLREILDKGMRTVMNEKFGV